MVDIQEKYGLEFNELFSEMRPIIYKLMKQLYINTWDYDDYFQEGMITLHELLQKITNLDHVHTKFKVAYHQHLIDEIRHIKARKRGFDQLHPINVYDCADWIGSNLATPESEIVFNHLLEEVYDKLSTHYKELLVKQMHGEHLTRMQKYRLKEKIKAILFDED